MGIYLNKGNDAFKKALSRRIYVDKSMLISKTNHAIEHDDPFGVSQDLEDLVRPWH